MKLFDKEFTFRCLGEECPHAILTLPNTTDFLHGYSFLLKLIELSNINKVCLVHTPDKREQELHES